ncbi:MAG: hypothetical protein WCO13_08310 [Bacteroidota bacterium]
MKKLFFLIILLSLKYTVFCQYTEVDNEYIHSEFFKCRHCIIGVATIEKKYQCRNCADWADSYRNIKGCDVCKNKKFITKRENQKCSYCNGLGIIRNTYYSKENIESRKRERQRNIEYQKDIEEEEKKEKERDRKAHEESERLWEKKLQKEQERKIERENEKERERALEPFLKTFSVSEFNSIMLGKSQLSDASLEEIFFEFDRNYLTQTPIKIKGFVVKDKKTNNFYLSDTPKSKSLNNLNFNVSQTSLCSKKDISDKKFKNKEITISCFVNCDLGKLEISTWEMSEINISTKCLEKTRSNWKETMHQDETKSDKKITNDDYYITPSHDNVDIKIKSFSTIVKNNRTVNGINLLDLILTK